MGKKESNVCNISEDSNEHMILKCDSHIIEAGKWNHSEYKDNFI